MEIGGTMSECLSESHGGMEAVRGRGREKWLLSFICWRSIGLEENVVEQQMQTLSLT